MDFRVSKFAKDRVQPLAEEGLRVALQHAPRAEAFTDHVVARTSTARSWLARMRRKMATVAVLVLASWLFAHATFGDNGIMAYNKKHADFIRLTAENERVKKENDAYTQHIDSLRSDKKAIEKEAREVLHYVRPGEIVYVSPAPANPNRPAANTAQK